MAQLVIKYQNDAFVGHLSTPITNSVLTRFILKNLSAYRPLTALARGLEIGLAHGYFLIGPFVTLGPLRNSTIGDLAGLLATLGLIIILSLALVIYGNVSFENVDLNEKKSGFLNGNGWIDFTKGFIIGGFASASFAYTLLEYLKL
jgi:photosystem I subunit 11